MPNGCNGNGGQELFRYYGNKLSIQQSGPTTDGYLSSIDWNRFNSAGLTTPNVRIQNGQLQLWNPDQQAWHTLQVRGPAGGEYITIGAADTSPSPTRA